jgi:hypothetical protein
VQGTHDELLKLNGLYATLGRRQFLLDQAHRQFGMEADQVGTRSTTAVLPVNMAVT